MIGVKATYVNIARRSPAVLYEPENASRGQNTALLVMHSDEDYLSFMTGPQMAARGYTVLNANVRCKEGIIYSQIDKMHDVSAAVEYLRALPQVERVVLVGHSGGATLMSAYQAVAENGPEIFRTRNIIFPYYDNEVLTPADGIILLDPNYGNAVMQLFSLDPAIENEHRGVELNENLNLFNPKNGFDKKGSEYSEDFIRRFQKAQGIRNMYILEYALCRYEKLELGEGDYTDDEPLIIPGSAQGFFNNKLYAQDIRLLSHTRKAYPLIHPDGSLTHEVIYSIRRPENPGSLTGSLWYGARLLTVKTYLASYALRTRKDYGFDQDHVWGIEWDSTYSAVPGNMTHISVPLLVMGMNAGWEFPASETIYAMARSQDKTIAFVEGATNALTPARWLEKVPGQFGDTVKTIHDYVDGWLSAGRFG